MIRSWIVVGLGRCGLQLARAMRAAGADVRAAVSRSARSRRRARRCAPDLETRALGRPLPAADGVIVAVSDGAIESVAAVLADLPPPGCKVALHVAGARPAEALAPLRQLGVALGSLHPLVSFPRADGPAVGMAGAWAALEGDPRAVAAGRALARRLGLRSWLIAAGDKTRYHAAAAVAANLTHALVAAALDELTRAGLPRSQAAAALRPLVLGTVTAALAARGWDRLTGPLARGDAWTIATHLHALAPETAAAYCAVGRLAARSLAANSLLAADLAQALDRALTL